MIGILLAIFIGLTFFMTVRLHGAISFMALGVVGAGIYSVPAIIGLELPFYAFAAREAVLFPTSFQADLMVLVAWSGLFVGSLLFRPQFAAAVLWNEATDVRNMNDLALASAVLGFAGIAYLALEDGWLFFLATRYDQSASLMSLLWKWTALTGLVSATLARSRTLIAANALVLFIIFLRGDRTMVAVSAAALIVALAHQSGSLLAFLRPRRMLAFMAAATGVFFGKSTYLTLKSGFSGNGWSPTTMPFEDQALAQFEPVITYAHLGHVIDLDLNIGILEFLTSILGNLLISPSAFGVETNLYNVVVTATLPNSIRFGVAGNFTAHGWMVAGSAGVFLFYLLLAGLLRTADREFANRSGAVKLFWGCVGGILAFYAHRNGLDNLLSFIRQSLLACLAVYFTSLALKAVGLRRLSSRPVVPGQLSERIVGQVYGSGPGHGQ